MVASPRQLRRDGATASSASALAALAGAARALATGDSLDETLEGVAQAAATGVGASLAVVRVVDEERGHLVARAVVCRSPAVVAEVAGSRIALADVHAEAVD
jgi:hypothetical protein